MPGGRAAGCHPAADRGKHKMSTFQLDFLAILLLLFDETMFSETTGSDLSNGVGLVSVYALLKKYRAIKLSP